MADRGEWRLVIEQDRRGALIASAIAWAACLPLAYLLSAEMGSAAYVFILPFPVVTSFYALRSAFGENGRIEIDRQGFSVGRAASVERFDWDIIDNFRLGALGASAIHAGVPVVVFDIRDAVGRLHEQGLPGNTGLEVGRLLAGMQSLLELSRAGWPSLPATVVEAFPAVGAKPPDLAAALDTSKPHSS